MNYILGVIVLGCLCGLSIRAFMSKSGQEEQEKPIVVKTPGVKVAAKERKISAVPDGAGASGGESFDDGVEAGPEEPLSEEEAREREEERLVEAFDALTDRWMEPSADGVTMADVDAFAQQFKKIPASRREECLHRALNLVPDENVMLLAGILMDKSVEQDLVEAVYNDVLNRDEDVKKPILQQIFKDRTHPCWADTAWILDVTGELPEKK